MIWSLIKIIGFVVFVAAATLGAGYLLEMDGGVRIAFAGYEYNLTPIKTVIAMVILVVAVWVLLKLLSLAVAILRFLNGDETAISRYFDRNRERKGHQALSEGLMALASGEGRVAMAKAAKAEKYLNKPELTNLITAQAAEMAGDHKKAEDVYKRLLKDQSTRFVGVRGILKQKLAEGKTDVALKLAQTGFELKPKHEEMQDTLLRLQSQTEDWSGARDTLKAKLKFGNLPRDVHKRRDAVLALSEAKTRIEAGGEGQSHAATIEANRLSPDLIPAAILAAQAHVENGKPRLAVKALKKAWEVQPHPDLAAAFGAIEPEETPEKRIKRFTALTTIHPEHRETKLLLAELNISASDFPAARRALGDLVTTEPDARVLTIMAAIERGEGASDVVVKGWLARALNAPSGPRWICENCHHIHAEWAPVCENCQSFDTLAWTSPPKSEVATDGLVATSAGVLPLIVGTIEEFSDPVEDSEDGNDVVIAPEVETLITEAEILPDNPDENSEDKPKNESNL